MRKYLPFILILLILTVQPVTAHGYKIVDDAQILTSNEELVLNQTAEAIADKYDMDVAIVVIETLNGKHLETYASDYFRGAYGLGSKNSGIIFLVTMAEQEWTVRTFGNAADAVSDYDIDEIMDSILDDLSSGNYHEAFSGFLDGVENEYKAYANRGFFRLLIALLIGAAIAGIALYFMRRNMNTARAQHGARSYMTDSSYNLYQCQDVYLYSRTSRVRKQQSSHTGSHGGGGSRGGRSGKF